MKYKLEEKDKKNLQKKIFYNKIRLFFIHIKFNRIRHFIKSSFLFIWFIYFIENYYYSNLFSER